MPTLEELLPGIQCPRCGQLDTYAPRQAVQTYPTGDGNTVTVTLTVGECRICHEQVLDAAATEQVRHAIEQARAGSDAVEPTGTAYRLK